MTARTAHAGVMALVLALVAACGSDATSVSTTSTPVTSATSSIETTTPVESTVAPSTSTEPAEQAAAFPVAAFAAISEEPVTDELAAKLQSALEGLAARREMAEKGGMSATVMTADGTWSGTTGTADGVRDLQIDDQFAIASITKSVVATQVMLMVEAGELGLDDLAADHLPPDLGSYTNGATIRQLLSHRSGLRDYYDTTFPLLGAEPARVWTLADVLEVLPAPRGAAGDSFEYSGTNYLLLGLVIEQLSGRPVAEVLRDGALDMDGVERLVYQPDESPTEPMAMPGGRSTDALELGGGFLPSVASASAHTAEGGIASDSPSLARWWRAFCAGEIVSPATLTEMSAFDPDVDEAYGLGLFNPAHGYTRGTVGHQGAFGDFSYTAWAACLPEDGAVMVVLSNRPVDMSYELFYGMLRPFVEVLRSG